MDTDAVARLRRVIGRLSRQLNASATVTGLTPAQASVLGLVAGRGPISVGELTRIEGLHPTMTSRVIGKLDGLGLVRRVRNPDDLRAVTIEITPQGLEIHTAIKDERGATVARALDQLDESARDTILLALGALETLEAQLGRRADDAS